MNTTHTPKRPMFWPDAERERILDLICDRISEGEPLAKIVRDPGFPSLRTVYDWLEKSEEASARFARAREAGYDHIAADILDIIDGGDNNPNHAKNRAEIRLKLLAKWDPRRYGESVQLKHSNNEGGNLRDISEGEAATRLAAIIEAARRRAIPAPEAMSHSALDSVIEGKSEGDQ